MAHCYSVNGYLTIFKKTPGSDALATFLAKNQAINMKNEIITQLVAKRRNDLTRLREVSEVKSGIYETMESSDQFSWRGWAFVKDPTSPSDSVFMVLESLNKKKWFVSVQRFKTQDVADFYHSPERLLSGVSVNIITQNLPNGIYKIGLVFKESAVESLYWLGQSTRVRRTEVPKLLPEIGPTRPLKSNVYSVQDTLDLVIVDSWAFPADGHCRGCKSFYTLSSRKRNYVIEAATVPRQDVALFFRDSSLLLAGMEATFSKRTLEKDFYKLGMLIKDSINSVQYYSETDKIITAGIPEYAAPEPLVTNLEGKDPIKTFIDKLEDNKESVRIEGWAFISGTGTDPGETTVILKSTDRQYTVESYPVPRPDVQEHFRFEHGIGMAGFRTKFRKDRMFPGSYEICIAVKNKKTNKISMKCLGGTIRI